MTVENLAGIIAYVPVPVFGVPAFYFGRQPPTALYTGAIGYDGSEPGHDVFREDATLLTFVANVL